MWTGMLYLVVRIGMQTNATRKQAISVNNCRHKKILLSIERAYYSAFKYVNIIYLSLLFIEIYLFEVCVCHIPRTFLTQIGVKNVLSAQMYYLAK
jgi:hypothetical protein